MKSTETILDRILVDVRREVAEAQARRPLREVQRMISDAPPVRSLAVALSAPFGLIAEIKERSPSQGPMLSENVARAPAAYEQSKWVRAISVLTNATHFGMSIERLREVRSAVTKPLLRKDFIYDPYQIYEARAFGADAILLMANLLESSEMRPLHQLAGELGLEVLFECHTEEQIEAVPREATIYGINSRSFQSRPATYEEAKTQRAAGRQEDLTTDLSRFELGRHLPEPALKVAESGVHPRHIAAIRKLNLFDAVLVGTSLLTTPHGLDAELAAFGEALSSDSSEEET